MSVTTSPLRLAVAQYDVTRSADWPAQARRISDWVAGAASRGANLLVFPEYGGMEVAALERDDDTLAPLTAFVLAQRWLVDLDALYRELAGRHGVYIVAGSVPVAIAAGTYRNRAGVYGPHGPLGHQDKCLLTRYERALGVLEPGRQVNVFATPLGRIAVLICYDSQFPLLARRAVEQGADLLVAPSCTDAASGYHRVRTACQARALENQCFTAQSSLIGDAPWLPVVDVNHGAAGVFAPPETGFCDSGVLASGELNVPGWQYADLDIARVREVRRAGQVGNHADWPEQTAVGAVVTAEGASAGRR